MRKNGETRRKMKNKLGETRRNLKKNEAVTGMETPEEAGEKTARRRDKSPNNMGEIHVKSIRTGIDYQSGTGTLQMDMDVKNGLILGLEMTRGRVSTTAAKEELGEMIAYLQAHLIEVKKIEPTNNPHRYRIEYNAGGREGEKLEDVMQKINTYLSSDFVTLVISKMMGTTEAFLEHVRLREEKLKKELAKATKGKRGTYRMSGHLVDQRLKYTKAGVQRSIFDILEETTKDKIRRETAVPDAVVEGLRLTASETKVVDSLCKLLHETSQNKAPEERDYYAGNTGAVEMTKYGGAQATEPRLMFTYHELAREMKGGEAPSGKDIENAREVVAGLLSKKFLVTIKAYEVQLDKKGKKVKTERKVEEFRPLIRELKLTESEYVDDALKDTRKELVVALDPIFSYQINSKFILCPSDLTHRTMLAYGGHTISKPALNLRDYLMREKSNKRMHPEMLEENLYRMLAEKWMKEGRKGKVRQAFEKAVDTSMQLGLLKSWERTQGKTGENKIVFHLNMDWE